MKNKIYLLFVSLLSLCFFSCSNEISETSTMLTENNTRNIIVEEGELTIDELEERDRYINENDELFEGIMIFDSSEDLFSLLSEIDTMNYTDLENWYINNGFNNPILKSRIIYDSIFSEVLEEFGYSYNEYMHNENYIIDEYNVFEYFKDRMIRDYSNYINISEDYDEEYGAEYYIEPLSTKGFDELIFMNDRNMVIVGLSVYKLVGDILLSTSVYNFNETFANLMNRRDFELYLPAINREEVYYTNLSPSSSPADFLPLKWTVRGNHTKMKVKLRAFDFPNWRGDIIRHARLSVGNYKYGCFKKVYTTIESNVYLTGIGEIDEPYPFFFMSEGMFYTKTCKDKCILLTPIRTNRIYITYIDGSVENDWGLSIIF